MEETKRCPYCGEEILAVAKKCKHCGMWLEQDESDASALNSSKNVTESPTSTNDVIKSDKQKVSILYSFIIPIALIGLFGVGLAVFHNNYTYTDWWIDEENIIIPAVIVFIALLAIYYWVVYKTSVFSKVSVHTEKIAQSPSPRTNDRSVFSKYGKQISIVVIALLAIGGGVIYFHDKKEREQQAIDLQKNKIENFEKKIKLIKTDAKAIRRLSYVIFYDFYKNWRTAIFHNRAYDVRNRKARCKDFNEALRWRTEFYTQEKCYEKLRKWNAEIEALMKDVNNPPEEKYKDVVEKLKDIYYKADEVVEYCINPHGSLRDFGNKYDTLLTELDRAIKATDIMIDDNDDDADELFHSALSSDVKDYISNVLTNDD
jgi:hypothetical protein